MPETILIALVYSKAKKYHIRPLFKYKEIYYVLAIEFIYLYFQVALFNGHYEVVQYASLLKSVYLCSYLGLIFKYELYQEALIGSGLMLLGGLCNQIAIAVNGGKMPVFPSLSYLTGYVKPGAFDIAYEITKDFHILGGSETKLKIFTDFLDIGYSILSIGDLLIRAFIVLIIYGAIKKMNRLKEKA